MYNAGAFRDPETAHYLITLLIAVASQYVYFWRMWVHMGNVAISSKASNHAI